MRSTSKPRSNQKVANNGFVVGGTLKAMWLWHPELSEIKAWFETKAKEFAEAKNRNPNHDSEAWLQKYIYTDVHEVFFATFPSELQLWVERLADSTGYVRSDKPT